MEPNQHPTFITQVDVEHVGKSKRVWLNSDGTMAFMSTDEQGQFNLQQHDLIYTDGDVALTLYEHCYAMWYLSDGSLGGGSLWLKGDWRLTRASIDKIRETTDKS